MSEHTVCAQWLRRGAFFASRQIKAERHGGASSREALEQACGRSLRMHDGKPPPLTKVMVLAHNPLLPLAGPSETPPLLSSTSAAHAFCIWAATVLRQKVG